MKDPRAAFTAARVGNKVYLCGGRNSSNALSACESFNLNSLTFASISPMHEPRLVTPSVVLPDSTIYIPSGLSNLSNLMTATCEIYDPKTDTWTYTTNLIEAREAETNLLLNDSLVLIAAGALAPNGPYRNTCELFNLNTKKVTFTGSLSTGQFGPTMFLDKQRNKVTFISDHYNGQHGTWLKATEEYDITSGNWSVVTSSQVPHGVGGGQAIQLPDGDIIAPSGSMDPGGADYAATDLIEIYTPSTHSWRTLGSVRIPRFGATSAYIGGDSVMLVGGYSPASGGALDDCEIINLKTGAVTAGPKLNDARMSHCLIATSEPDIENPCLEVFKVYVFGGESTTFTGSLTSCEMIEFRRMKQTALSIPDSILLGGSVCEAIDTTITIGALACSELTIDSILLAGLPSSSISASLPAVFSGDSSFSFDIVTRDSVVSSHQGFVHIFYHYGSVTRDTIIPVTATFKGTSTTLSCPSALSYKGTVCDGIDTTFTIRSNSCFDLVVDSLRFTGIPFSTVTAATPFPMASAVPVLIPLSIHTTTPGISNGTIHIWYHSAGIFHDTTISVSADLRASTRGSIRAIFNDVLDAGDTVEVPLYLNSNSGEVIEGFDLYLRYNTDLLSPITPKFTGTLCEGAGLYNQNRLPFGHELYVPFPFSLSTTKPLVILRFMTYVTDTTCTALILDKLRLAPDDPSFANCIFAVTNDSAVICRANACGDVTLRHFIRNNTLDGIYSAHYDGPTNSIVIRHSLGDGDARLTLYDELGRMIEEKNVTLGGDVLRMNAEGIHSGVAFIVMKCGGSFATARVIIQK